MTAVKLLQRLAEEGLGTLHRGNVPEDKDERWMGGNKEMVERSNVSSYSDVESIWERIESSMSW